MTSMRSSESRSESKPAPEPTVVVHKSGEANVSFIAGGQRVITRPGNQAAGTGRALDALSPGDPGYDALVVEEFAKMGVTVTVKDIEKALKDA